MCPVAAVEEWKHSPEIAIYCDLPLKMYTISLSSDDEGKNSDHRLVLHAKLKVRMTAVLHECWYQISKSRIQRNRKYLNKFFQFFSFQWFQDFLWDRGHTRLVRSCAVEGAIVIITYYVVYISITFFYIFNLEKLIEKLTKDRANSHYAIGSYPIRMLLRKLDHK